MADPELSLEQAFELDSHELYETVGREVIAEHRRAVSGKISPYMSAGRAWLRQKRKSLAKLICLDDNVQTLLRQRNVNRLTLAGAILDLLLSVTWAIAPTSVAVLLVREGIESLCEDFIPHFQFDV